MVWIRDWSWRIAILLLPWQVRWFLEGPTVGGFPWEQGRVSVYGSWFLMAIVIFFASQKHRAEHRPLPKHAWFLFGGVLLVALSAVVSIYPQASWQWIVQISLVAMFVWALGQLRIRRGEMLGWILLSLVPHALLGIWQYVSQSVVGSKWLGMSSQHPADLGVSVVDVNGRRVLRAYGGFPHPNILGGWLAFGLGAATLLASRITLRRDRILLTLMSSFFAMALVLTFSRSAWLSAVCGVLAISVVSWRKAWTLDDKLKLFLIPLAIIVVMGGTAYAVRDVIRVRTSGATRLEAKSVDERVIAARAAWNLAQARPLLGHGPGTALLALDRVGQPAVPPHQILLLGGLETGIFGLVGLLILFVLYMRFTGPAVFPWLILALPILFFDHYAWSLWSGQALIGLLALIPLTKDEK